MNARTTVLVSGGETLGALAAVRALRDAGHDPWVAVHDWRAYAARSRAAAGVVAVPDPAGDETGFARALAAAATGIPASLVLPGTEPDLVALSRRVEFFPRDVVVGVCPPAVVERAIDKTLLADLARTAGLEVPETVEVSASDGTCLPIPYPVVIKPLKSDLRGSRGVSHHYSASRVDSAGQLRDAVAALPCQRALVQPYLQGAVGSIAGVFWDGRMVAAVQARADRIWPPYCGSFTHAITIPLDQELSSRIGGLLRAIGWNGLFQVDFIEHSGRNFLIDLNPRMYTSLAITTAAGVNLPAIWVDLLRGAPPRVPPQYAVGVGYRHDEDDVRALLRMLARGPRATALRGLMPRRRTVHPVFSIRDPMPFLTSIVKLARTIGLGGRHGKGGAPPRFPQASVGILHPGNPRSEASPTEGR